MLYPSTKLHLYVSLINRLSFLHSLSIGTKCTSVCTSVAGWVGPTGGMHVYIHIYLHRLGDWFVNHIQRRMGAYE